MNTSPIYHQENHSEIGVINLPAERYRLGAPPCGGFRFVMGVPQ